MAESGAWSLQSVESWVSRRRCGLEAQLCQLSRKPARSCGESRRELAGRLAKPELNRGYASYRGDGTLRLTPQGTTRVQVTCNGLVGLVRSAKSRAIKTQEVQSDPLVFEGGLFLGYLNECCGAVSPASKIV